MLNLLAEITTTMQLEWGNAYFGVGTSGGRPALCIFGFPIYFYALFIVTGMALAILIGGLYFKKRGYDPYDITIYALVIIPIGVLGARMYVYIFPWDETHMMSGWSTFFDFRSGGLGIYGGVILGYLAAFVCCKVRKQDFRIIADSIIPGLFLAQSIGRWGNFANQEAFGNLITTDYDAMVNLFSFLGRGRDHGFNGIAVWIDASNAGGVAGWYQATFFYESVCTFIGFLVCVLVLLRSKRYKLGWCAAFYGIYYGIVRLVVEGLRTDSLYLFIGAHKTDIKISQLVSVFTITLGILLLSQIYRKQLHSLYAKLFKSEREQLAKSRWILIPVTVLSLALAVTMFVLGGESRFIVGFFATLLCLYSFLGIFALQDRLKLYCANCGKRNLPQGGWQSDRDKYRVRTAVYAVVSAALVAVALFSLIKWGIADGLDNGYVLAVAALLCCVYFVVVKLVPAVKNYISAENKPFESNIHCECGNVYDVKLNAFLLFFFPPKVYPDYGVENLKPWVDPEPQKGKKTQGENMRNLTLLTDFYELTMMYGYFLQGKTEEEATFDLFFRPYEESNFCIAAGLEQAVEYLENLHFGDEEIQYLRSTNSFSEEFLAWLKDFRFTGSVKAVPEGTVVFPYEPLMVITAPICQAQLVEAALLNIVNFQTLIATKARRICHAASPASVLEFGLRRAQAPDASLYGARAAVIGGCSSTSNVLCAKMFGLPPKGTHAHSWVMSFPTELEAFMAYADTYPTNCLLLVDTYDTLKSGVPNAIKVFDYLKSKGYQPLGIRLDSGDLAYLSKEARKMLDEAGHADCKIFASSDIDEYVLNALKQQNAAIDIYGVGTKLITSHTTPSLGGVYKLSNLRVNGVDYPKMKISDNPMKMTNPGKKVLYRLFDKNSNKALADLICLEGEVIDETKPLTIIHPVDRWKTKVITDFYAQPLYVDVFEKGKCVWKHQDVYALQEQCRRSVDGFWEEYTRLFQPHDYKVDLSDELYRLKQSLILDERKLVK